MLLFYAWTSSYYFWQGHHWAWRMWWSTSTACRRNHQEHLAKKVQQTQASSTRQLKNWYPYLWWSRGKRLVVVLAYPETMAACVSGACSNVTLFLMYAGPPVHENRYIHGEWRGCCSGPWWCSLRAHTFLKASLESSQSGQFRKTSRDFLACDATTTTISRGRTAWKRKCCLIRLSCLPSHLQSQLKRCKPNLTSMITVKGWNYGLFWDTQFTSCDHCSDWSEWHK